MANEVRIEVGPDDAVQKILVAKDLTKRMGVLVELQVHQLRLWPLAILNAKASEAEFSFDDKMVRFRIKGFEGEQPADLSERIANLRTCVQYLLGTEYHIEVKMGRKTLK